MQIEIVRETPLPPPIKEVVLRLSEEQAMFICWMAAAAAMTVQLPAAASAATKLYNVLKPAINYSIDKVDFGISY